MGWGKFKKVFKGDGNWLTNLAESVDASYSEATMGNKDAKVVFQGLSGNAAAGIFSYSKDKGMSSDEAAQNAGTFGAGYSQASAARHQRVAIEDEDARMRVLNRQRAADDRKERLSKDVRARRSRTSDLPGTKNGTLLTGSLGIVGNSSSKLGE